MRKSLFVSAFTFLEANLLQEYYDQKRRGNLKLDKKSSDENIYLREALKRLCRVLPEEGVIELKELQERMYVLQDLRNWIVHNDGFLSDDISPKVREKNKSLISLINKEKNLRFHNNKLFLERDFCYDAIDQIDKFFDMLMKYLYP